MGFALTKSQYDKNEAVCRFFCDNAEDIEDLPTDAPAGSTATCAEDGNTYVLSTGKTWVTMGGGEVPVAKKLITLDLENETYTLTGLEYDDLGSFVTNGVLKGLTVKESDYDVYAVTKISVVVSTPTSYKITYGGETVTLLSDGTIASE